MIAILILFILVSGLCILMVLQIDQGVRRIRQLSMQARSNEDPQVLEKQVKSMDNRQLKSIVKLLAKTKTACIAVLFVLCGGTVFGQDAVAATKPLISETGILITIFLIMLPVLAGLFLMAVRIRKAISRYTSERNEKIAGELADYLVRQPQEEVHTLLEGQEQRAAYQLSNRELAGEAAPVDQKGLLNVKENSGLAFVAEKRKALQRSDIEPKLSQLVLAYLITATFWLLFGTTVGEYVGIKFVAPDVDQLSWLSFGRLRPVHTNSVFWGWASLGMLGLGYYVVPRVGNQALYSYKLGWYALYLINATVLLGTIALMSGINNGGGEYREYIWPIMLLFGIGLGLTLYNYLKTIARRKTREIYISNWYIVSAVMFGLVIAIVAYWPSWQNGLGETIIQGYYMHQGVGMWFMLFTLGLVYYYLPQQLNKPIYSYSLGILAFWTQILFYTLIGTHHFVFSSIPWWLQTVAIFGSVGMVIPVAAGTTNFLMTFKNGWYKLGDSYTLPFFLVGTIFYFTGSLQGTAEAFRSTNLIWHFTDFTVAHSHLTMYGIISFFLWACIYTIVPRLTHQEAPQIMVGAHFWLALIGLLFYTVPLMYGSTMRGQMWIEGKPFIESVVMMAPHWLWRAIGGSLMWLSHLFFAYNLYRMMPRPKVVDINEKTLEILEQRVQSKVKMPQ